jgi:hypothetical protein
MLACVVRFIRSVTAAGTRLEFRMIKQATMTMVAWAALAAAPADVGAQTTPTTPRPDLATCDCPAGDARGSLRNLAAFAPLGLLGALAAAGGTPTLFSAQPVVTPMVATNDPATKTEAETPITESARTVVGDPAPVVRTGTPTPSPRIARANIPEPVSPDSLRGGVRAPNTGTPLPSVFLLGSGLVAIGCVALHRTRG